MSQKNTTPARGARAGGGAETPDLAELLSAVLRHPDIPAELHTDLGDWIVSYGNPQVDEPGRIRRALAEWADEKQTAGRGAKGEAGREGAPGGPAGGRLDELAATITCEEAGALARRLTRADLSSETYATVLLLIAAATFEGHPGAVYWAAWRELLPEIREAGEAAGRAHLARPRELRRAESGVR